MKYIYFGTPDFSAHFLKILLERGIIPVAVVCNPDRPVGRKKIIAPPPVKERVMSYELGVRSAEKIEILQPEKLDAAFREQLRAFDADLFIVFAYGKIFRQEVLAIPRAGAIGVHPSFLPEYRGPSPFQTAILDGKTETGVSLYYLDEGIDSGPTLAKSEPVAITDEDNFSSLATKLADAGAVLMIKTLPEILAGKAVPIAQDESRATYTKKFATQDGFINEQDLADTKQAHQILRKINAFNPEPGAWTMQNGKRIKLLGAKIENGDLKLTLTQVEGEKPKSQA